MLTTEGLLVGVIQPGADGLFQSTGIYGNYTDISGRFTEGLAEGQEFVFRHNGITFEPGTAFGSGVRNQRQDLVFDALLSTKTEEGADYGLRVFPNPLSDLAKVNLEVGEAGTYSVRVLDVTGRSVTDLLTETRLTAGTYGYEWNTARLAVGSYTVLVTRNGELLPELSVRVIK